MYKSLVKYLSFSYLFLLCFLVSAENLKLSNMDTLKMPLPLPYNGVVYSEVEIDNFSQQEGSLEKLKNLMSKGVHEKWMTSISKIELAVCEMAEHVKMWELDSVHNHISWDLRFVMIPKNEPCEKRYPCKNCLNVNPVQAESRYAPFVSAESEDLEGRKLWLLSVLNSSRASVGMGPIDLQKSRAIAPPALPTQAHLEKNLFSTLH